MCFVMLLHIISTRLVPSSENLSLHPAETILNLEFRSLAFVGENCFILISGYFGIKWKPKSFSSLLFRILFWTFVWIFDANFNYQGNLISNIFTLRWFIGAYLCLYLMAPALNAFVERESQKELGRFIIVFYIASTIFGWMLKSTEFNEGMNVLSLSGLYLIGRYLKKTEVKIFTYSAWINLALYAGLGFLLVVASVFALKLGISKSLYGYLNPVVILQSIYLFLFFKRLKFGHISIINMFATSAFSVYLFHTDICSRPTWYHLCDLMNAHGAYISLVYIFLLFVCIFTICVLIDWMGNMIFRVLGNGYKRIITQ